MSSTDWNYDSTMSEGGSADLNKYLLKSGGTLSGSLAMASNNITGLGSIDTGTLKLSGVSVTSSASELNSVATVVPGTCTASKALVVDASKDLTGINELTCTTLNATDLTVNGTTTFLNTENLKVKDPLTFIASENPSDTLDIGMYGKYVDGGGTTRYTGIYRDATSGNYSLFKSLEVAPTTTVDETGAGYALGDLVINKLTTDLIDLKNGSSAIDMKLGSITNAGSISTNSGNVNGTLILNQIMSSNINNAVNIAADIDFVAPVGSNTSKVKWTKGPFSTTAGTYEMYADSTEHLVCNHGAGNIWKADGTDFTVVDVLKPTGGVTMSTDLAMGENSVINCVGVDGRMDDTVYVRSVGSSGDISLQSGMNSLVMNGSGTTMYGGINMNANSFTNVLHVDGQNNDNLRLRSQGTGGAIYLTSGSGNLILDNNGLSFNNLALNSQLDMGSNKIINCTDPTAAQDVSTKAYVDSKASPEYTFQAYKDVAQNGGSGVTLYPTWNGISTNVGGFSLGADNYTVTVPVTGMYLVTWSMAWASNANGWRYNSIQTGAGPYYATNQNHGILRLNATNGYYTNTSGSTMVRVAAGDTVHLYAVQTSGTNLAMGGTSNELRMEFSISRVGSA
jgi:hypothetical protein